MNQDLNNWILQARKTGHTDPQIKEYLISHGYQAQQIDQAFVSLNVDQSSGPAQTLESDSQLQTNTLESQDEQTNQTPPPETTTPQNQDNPSEVEKNPTPTAESLESESISDLSVPESDQQIKSDLLDQTQEAEKVTSPESDTIPTQESENHGVALNYSQANKFKDELSNPESDITPTKPTEKSETINTVNQNYNDSQSIETPKEPNLLEIEKQIDSIYQPDTHETNYNKKHSMLPMLIFFFLLLIGGYGAYYFYNNLMKQEVIEPEVVIEQTIPKATITPKFQPPPPEPVVEPEPILEPETPITEPEPIMLPEPEEPLQPEAEEVPKAIEK